MSSGRRIFHGLLRVLYFRLWLAGEERGTAAVGPSPGTSGRPSPSTPSSPSRRSRRSRPRCNSHTQELSCTVLCPNGRVVCSFFSRCKSSVADPSFHPDSRVKKIPDPGSRSALQEFLTPKNCFKAFGKNFWDVHLDPDLEFLPIPGSQIPDSGTKKAPDPQHYKRPALCDLTSRIITLRVGGAVCQFFKGGLDSIVCRSEQGFHPREKNIESCFTILINQWSYGVRKMQPCTF